MKGGIIMTNNEFKYKQLEQAGRELAEQSRHSRVTESIEYGKLGETMRHQAAQEAIDRARNDETLRHDQAMEAAQNEANRVSRIASEAREHSAQASMVSAKSSQLKNLTDAKLAPKYYKLDERKTETGVKKTISDINTNDRNATTNEYNAETSRLKWMTDTTLQAGNFVLDAVKTAGGTIGSLVKLF
jgi:hypothetical protein